MFTVLLLNASMTLGQAPVQPLKTEAPSSRFSIVQPDDTSKDRPEDIPTRTAAGDLLGSNGLGSPGEIPKERPVYITTPQTSIFSVQHGFGASPDDVSGECPVDITTPTPAADFSDSNGLGSKPWEKVWGLSALRGFYYGSKEAPNGERYTPLFSLDIDLNVALTKDRSVYLFTQTRFWGESGSDAGVAQSNWDFSKRQFDLTLGGAWNYYDALEFRAFGYSYNNLNRGNSSILSSGYNDGYGIENRYYFRGTDFDRGLFNYVGAGVYPGKTLIDLTGNTFTPSWYLTGSVNVSIWDDFAYAYCMAQLTARNSGAPKLFWLDAGVAMRPFTAYPALEFRVGSENNCDIENKIWLPMWYLSLRFAF